MSPPSRSGMVSIDPDPLRRAYSRSFTAVVGMSSGSEGSLMVRPARSSPLGTRSAAREGGRAASPGYPEWQSSRARSTGCHPREFAEGAALEAEEVTRRVRPASISVNDAVAGDVGECGGEVGEETFKFKALGHGRAGFHCFDVFRPVVHGAGRLAVGAVATAVTGCATSRSVSNTRSASNAGFSDGVIGSPLPRSTRDGSRAAPFTRNS